MAQLTTILSVLSIRTVLRATTPLRFGFTLIIQTWRPTLPLPSLPYINRNMTPLCPVMVTAMLLTVRPRTSKSFLLVVVIVVCLYMPLIFMAWDINVDVAKLFDIPPSLLVEKMINGICKRRVSLRRLGLPLPILIDVRVQTLLSLTPSSLINAPTTRPTLPQSPPPSYFTLSMVAPGVKISAPWLLRGLPPATYILIVRLVRVLPYETSPILPGGRNLVTLLGDTYVGLIVTITTLFRNSPLDIRWTVLGPYICRLPPSVNKLMVKSLPMLAVAAIIVVERNDLVTRRVSLPVLFRRLDSIGTINRLVLLSISIGSLMAPRWTKGVTVCMVTLRVLTKSMGNRRVKVLLRKLGSDWPFSLSTRTPEIVGRLLQWSR